MADVCKSCKAPVRWAVTENGRLMPLDREPDDTGEWRLAASRRRCKPHELDRPL
jgi:hypothetical protein